LSAPKRARAPRGRRGSAVHQGLVGARKLVGTPYLADAELRGEYAREIAPRTEAALARVLDEVWGAPGALPPRRAIDLGAGTGAVGRTLRRRFGEGLEVVEVDRTAAPGNIRANLAVELPPLDGAFDLIVAAHLLNELFVDRASAERVALRASRVLVWAERLLAPAGRLILIEPALRETSRELLAVRDRLLAAGLHVIAPCFWTGPCPALARDRDWCHDAARVPSRPRVDFSYLVLCRELVPPRPFHRVVSDPLPEKGRLRFFVCGPTGRHELVRLTRHRSPSNQALDDATRGDAIVLENLIQSGDERRVTAASNVTRPASPERLWAKPSSYRP
jgi:SAM-dependent methyltransferase